MGKASQKSDGQQKASALGARQNARSSHRERVILSFLGNLLCGCRWPSPHQHHSYQKQCCCAKPNSQPTSLVSIHIHVFIHSCSLSFDAPLCPAQHDGPSSCHNTAPTGTLNWTFRNRPSRITPGKIHLVPQENLSTQYYSKEAKDGIFGPTTDRGWPTYLGTTSSQGTLAFGGWHLTFWTPLSNC